MSRSAVRLGSLVMLFSSSLALGAGQDLQPFQAEDVKPVAPAPQVQPARAQDLQPSRSQDVESTRAEDVRPYRAQDIQPTRAEDVQPTRAQEVQPLRAQDIEPTRAQDLQPSRAQDLRGGGGAAQPGAYQADTPALFQAEPAQLAPKPGVDPVSRPGPLQRELVGTWKLEVPSSSYTTRTFDGPNVIDTTRSTAGARMGVLRVFPDGRFVFHRQGRQVASGRVREVRPRLGADAAGRYWTVRDEREEFYVNVTGGKLSLFTVGGNSFVAHGTR